MAAGRVILPCMPALDSNGRPVSGALLNFYENNTTTRKAVYTSADLTTPLTNPVVADAAGAFPSIFADDDELYSVTCFSPLGIMLPKASYSSVRATVAIGDGLITASSFMQTVLDDTSAAAARTTLGAVSRAGDSMTGILNVNAGLQQIGVPSVPIVFDVLAARAGATLNLTGSSTSMPEIGMNVTIDNSIPTGGGKPYVIGGYFYVYGAPGTCTVYGINPVARLGDGTPGTAGEFNTDGIGVDVGNGNANNSLWNGDVWKTGINIIAGGAAKITAGLVVTSAYGTGKLLNRGILIDSDSINKIGIEDTSQAPIGYKQSGAKGVGIDLSAGTYSTAAMKFPANAKLNFVVGGTPTDLFYVSGSDVYIANAARLILGQPTIPAGDNGTALGAWSGNRWSSVNTVITKQIVATLVASTAPGTPAAGEFYIYMDSADSKLKCKGPSGTVTTIGNP